MFLRQIFRQKNESHPRKCTDGELIKAYIESEAGIYLNELFNRYSHLVYGVCLKYLKNEEDSKDAVMQIFENLMDTLKKQPIDHFSSWLYTVSKNHCLMMLRKAQSLDTSKAAYLEKIHLEIMELQDAFHQHNKTDLNDKLPFLQGAIEKLGDEQRKCIELLYLHDKTYQEVSMETGYSLKQVKSYIQNGKRNLRIYLEKI